MNDPGDTNRQRQLDAARRRLTELEVETHRLRAQLAKLEATGEEAAAARLEAELAQRTEETSATEALLLPERTPSDKSPEVVGQTISQREPAESFAVGDNRDATDKPEPNAAVPFDLESEAGAVPREKRKSPKAWLRNTPAWVTSLGVHAALVLLFSLMTFVTLQETPNFLLANAVDGEDEYLDDFAAVDFTPVELDETSLEQIELEPTEVTEETLSELDAPWDAAAAGASDATAGLDALPTDMASLLLGESDGQPEGAGKTGDKPDGGGKPGTTRFFGSKSRGERFVFLIDNSASMKQGRMETTMLELQKAIGAMSAKQMFYVVFYSDQAYPMFFPDSVDQMQPATRENKQRLGEWLNTVEMCTGGKVQDAMEMAVELDPHVVYLLSDGDIRSAKVMDFLTADNGWPFAVHTLGMTVRDAEAASRLVAIARANRGVFTPVGVNPIAAEMALRRPIPYHNKGPGPVWGSKVRRQ
ncbi:MAG: hypothetical protein AAF589_04185 [Planctomycetota bacterium]